MEKFLTTLKNYWFLILTLVALSAAWGQSQVKIQTLEDAIKQNTTTQEEVVKLKTQSERIDERTRSLQESQVRQERMIEMLLNNQNTLIRQTKK